CYFRSQHDNQSWVAAFTAVLDVCALMISYATGPVKWQAQLTFAISRHAVVDLAEVLRIPLTHTNADRLPKEDVAAVRGLLVECGASQNCAEVGDMKLAELREMYEPYLAGLASRLQMPLPGWGVGARYVENWKRSAWGKISSGPGSTSLPGD